MALTEIEYGSLASSAILNHNFQFLQDKITELSALITSETSSYSSTVATLNTSITNLLAYKDSFIPTGTIIISQSVDIPTGFLLCDGSEVKIDDYSDLYAVIGTTYGQSDSTTFCLPDLKDKLVWGKGVATTVGQVIAAGLPNIEGYLTGQESQHGAQTHGALKYKDTWGGVHSGRGGAVAGTMVFNASWANSIYGNSNTVQPPAVVTNFVIKY